MRVRGNSLPDVVDVTAYEPIPGKAEVRVRENITPFSEKDPETGETESGYEYDEYKFVMDDAIGLSATIKKNLSDWLATARTLEINESASTLMDMKDALKIVGVQL